MSEYGGLTEVSAKVQIQDTILGRVFDHAYEQLQERTDALIRENNAIHGNDRRCMRYGTTVYWLENRPQIAKGIVPRMDRSLRPEMDSILREREEMNLGEFLPVRSYLANALNMCREYGDLFLVFPSCLHDLFPPNDQTSLDPEDAKAFRHKHAWFEHLLKDRMVVNLLT